VKRAFLIAISVLITGCGTMSYYVHSPTLKSSGGPDPGFVDVKVCLRYAELGPRFRGKVDRNKITTVLFEALHESDSIRTIAVDEKECDYEIVPVILRLSDLFDNVIQMNIYVRNAKTTKRIYARHFDAKGLSQGHSISIINKSFRKSLGDIRASIHEDYSLKSYIASTHQKKFTERKKHKKDQFSIPPSLPVDKGAPPAKAEIKTFTYTVRQPFGGSQSPDDARIGAIAKAKREVLEQAGTYLESLTVIRESVVAKDEILALAAGVLKTKIVSQKNYATEDGFGLLVVAKVEVDTSILEQRVNKFLQDRSLLEKYRESQRREKELLAKIQELEKRNSILQTLPTQRAKQKREELKEEFNEVTKGLTAIEWNQKAIALFKQGAYTDPQRAISYLNEAIRLDPNQSIAYSNRGLALINLGKNQRAIGDLNEAIRLDPNNAIAYNNRGMALINLGKYQQGFEDCDKAIRLDPNLAMAYNNRGLALINLGKNQQGLEDCDKAIRLDPNHPMPYNNRGLALINLGKNQQAIEDFNKAIRLNPNLAMPYSNRGLALINLGKYQQGFEDCDKAIRLDPNLAIPYNNRGLALINLGKNQQAIEDFNEAIRLDPNFAMPYSNRGFTLISLGKYQQAIEDVNVAIRLDPNNAPAYYVRGRAHDSLGLYQNASADFKQANRLNPNLQIPYKYR
jgi:tetratricopeptide (TPR) repeat protein